MFGKITFLTNFMPLQESESELLEIEVRSVIAASFLQNVLMSHYCNFLVQSVSITKRSQGWSSNYKYLNETQPCSFY